jgi:hypothetical protein
MTRRSYVIGALVVGSSVAVACSSSEIPAGLDDGVEAGGDCAAGNSVCAVTPDAGNDASGGGGQDAGGCCPPGWDLYTCAFADGGAGQACHNPQLGCASSTTCGQGCDPVVTGRCGASVDAGSDVTVGSDGAAGSDGGVGSQGQWFETCGYPVCAVSDGGTADAGVVCPPAGSPCSPLGAMCGVPSPANCGVTLVCATQDPKVAGCPKSSRKYKDGIAYVDAAQLEKLHDEALGIKLATYTYKPNVADPGPTHLGFILEDNLETPAVDRAHDGVDLYGYVSMAIAGMQVQEKEIAELRHELEAARHDIAACKASRK